MKWAFLCNTLPCSLTSELSWHMFARPRSLNTAASLQLLLPGSLTFRVLPRCACACAVHACLCFSPISTKARACVGFSGRGLRISWLPCTIGIVMTASELWLYSVSVPRASLGPKCVTLGNCCDTCKSRDSTGWENVSRLGGSGASWAPLGPLTGEDPSWEGGPLFWQRGTWRTDAERRRPVPEQWLHSPQRVSGHAAASSLGLLLSP